jgi:hypothetical protein
MTHWVSLISLGVRFGNMPSGRGVGLLPCIILEPGHKGNVGVLLACDAYICAAIFYIPRHGYAECSGRIIPIQLDTAVQAACPIYGKLVFFLSACNQMVNVLFANVFYSKINNN